MKIYKYKDFFVLLATIGWLSFIFAAFKGFHFWYLGFVFFFWLSLGILNYRHESTIWLMKNRWYRFLRYYLMLVVFGFVVDYIVGQGLMDVWIYPFYNSSSDWLRLYFLIYPIGGLSLIELIYFLASIFKEKVILIHGDVKDLIITKLEFTTDILLLLIIFACLISKNIISSLYVQNIIIILFLIWTILITFKLKYYIKHWTHWIAIVGATTILSIFMHEIPNTAAYEWKYYYPPLFPHYSIWGIQLWLVWGWYFLVLIMLKYWIQIVLLKDRK